MAAIRVVSLANQQRMEQIVARTRRPHIFLHGGVVCARVHASESPEKARKEILAWLRTIHQSGQKG